MKNKQFNKTLIGATGKDLLNLVGGKEIRTQQQDIILPTGATETELFQFWKGLLGHDGFGVEDDFFQVGGNSLKAIQLLSRITTHFFVQISLTDIFLHPTIAGIAKLIDAKPNGSDLLPTLITVSKRPQNIPLSFNQERLWFIHQLAGSLQYHIPAVMRLTGKLNKEALAFAFAQVMKRHEAFRSLILENDGQCYQHIQNANGWQLYFMDGSRYKNNAEGLHQYIHQLINKPFDLAKDYMLRATLISLDEQESLLVVNMHHIASDGWSLQVIIKEVVELYSAFVEARPSKLAPLAIQYADFAMWQRNYFKGTVLDNKLGYWKEKLKGVLALQLPTDFVRPVVQSNNGASLVFNIDKDLSDEVQSLCQQQGVTIFMGLLAAFKVLLQRYSGQQDICVGTPIAGRQQEEVEGLVGFFVNTLALRTQVNNEDSFLKFLGDVKTTTMDAYEHQEAPFEKVVEVVVKERDMGRSPVFQVMFALQNTPDAPELQLPDLVLSGEAIENNSSKFDISFFITETANGLQGSVEYCTALYKEETITRMIGHYKILLGSIVENPVQKTGLLPMLTADEQHQLLVSFNDTVAIFPSNKTIIDLFEEQVLKTPGHTAVVFENRHLSYEALNKKANQFAHYLRGKGLKAETLVPICMERSLEMMIGILGILKAGAAYVPIDPEYPEDRISYMLKDTRATMVVCNRQCLPNIPTLPGLTIIELDSELSTFSNQPENNCPNKILSNHLAYVIYTSGSTGKPKGVMNEHAGVVNRLCWAQDYFGLTETDAILQKTTFCFDVSVWELFWPLLFGARLVFAKPEGHKDPGYLKRIVEQEHITIIHFVPSMLGVFLSGLQAGDCASLKKLLCSGEALLPSQVTLFAEKFSGAELYNLYGPTEAAIDVTCWNVPAKKEGLSMVPIGKPVANTSIYILNSMGVPVPLGSMGEINIGGVQVARGYLNLPELTAEKFVNDPFNIGKKMYRTGDLGRWLADGNLAYLGRIDDQVKIRGFRVELGEIETVLEQCDLVAKAIVLAKEGNDSGKRLVGYIVPNGEYSTDAIVSYLKGKLPDYMVPAIWVQMETMPLTPNGKIDRKALPDPDISVLILNNYVPPQNQMQKALVEIWQRLLGVQQVGIHDNFFVLGGHSLLAMRVLSSIKKELEVELVIKDFFLHPTIVSLAIYLQKQVKGLLLPSIELQPRPAHIPLSFSQERLWFIDRLEGSTQYHLPLVLRLNGKLNIDALSNSFQTIVQRHEVLRTVIQEEDGQPYQLIRDHKDWCLTIIQSSEKNMEASQTFIQQIINAPFDLSKDYMLRACLIVINETEHVLVVTLHHIASDGWSMSIIVKEVLALYNASLQGRPAHLPSLPVQYADYAIWQRHYLQGDILEKKLGYWKNKLEGVLPLQLPADYARPATQSAHGADTLFSIDKTLSEQLLLLSLQQGATLFMTLLTAFKVLLFRYSHQQDICVGTGAAGRQQQELEGLVGFFVNTLALRSQVQGDESFTDLLQQIKITTLEAYQHQDVPFEKVVDAVAKERDKSRAPLFQVMFVMQNTPEVPEFLVGETTLTQDAYVSTIALYDITFFITETADGLQGNVQYCTDLYDQKTMLRMLAHYEQLLTAIVKSPAKNIASLAMLSHAEEHQLLVGFNDTLETHSANKHIINLFEEQVAKSPAAIALVFQEEEISFQQLNERANQLAHYLNGRGIGKDGLVPICIERCPEMLVAILGILKSGAAYLPIDPEYPQERIRFILEDAGATIAIISGQYSPKLQGAQMMDIIELKSDWPIIDNEPIHNPVTKIIPHQLAYVIYTSGSTGKPKGVMIEHAALLNYLLNNKTRYVNNEDVGSGSFIHLSYTFDASLTALFMPLLFGKKIVMGSKQGIEVFEDNNLWKHAPYSFIKITPSHIELLQAKIKDENGNLLTRKLVLGGEALRPSHFDHLIEQGVDIEIINEYGPTEATVGCSTYRFNTIGDIEKIKNGIPVGKPIGNVQLYILGKHNELVPIGVSGQICIGGDGLASGYLNQPGLTADKFFPNPFSENAGKTLYRTGDMGHWLPDGNIMYLGRMDDQVKIRGYRVELGEIEACLSSVKRIVDAKVLVTENESLTDKKLTAYLQVDKEKLPLLGNYLNLLNKGQVKKSDHHILPNGLPVFNSNLNEVRFLYHEIFEDHCYLKHGITLNENSCVVDIGANAGFFTVFLNILSENIKVYSIEPIPEVYNYLVANRLLYNVKGKALELAILDVEKEVDFTYYPQVSIVSGISDNTNEVEVKEVVSSYIKNSGEGDFLETEIDSLLALKLESRKIRCRAKTLSQVIAEEKIEKIDLLKIDVENSEHLVIKGISENDWDKIESLIIEVHDIDGRLDEMKEMLERKGFKTYVEKEKMLSKDDILYNLFALRDEQKKGLASLGNKEQTRVQQWQDPTELVKEIKAGLEERLPAYMIPANIILMDQFPLTTNGKIDKKALPAADNNELLGDAKLVAPRNELEKQLADIWKEILEIDEVGIHDDFFELGGHSLLVVRLIAAVRKELKVELAMNVIFELLTVAQLANYIKINKNDFQLQPENYDTIKL